MCIHLTIATLEVKKISFTSIDIKQEGLRYEACGIPDRIRTNLGVKVITITPWLLLVTSEIIQVPIKIL